MPMILSPDDDDLWLEPDFHGQGKLLEMLKPYPTEEREAYPVSTVVNNPRNEKKECVEGVSCWKSLWGWRAWCNFSYSGR
jgi:putative SOS response-associated peptidase YedK